jgi:hypothetical protein
MGSDEDPKDGGAVAGAVFGAVFIYIVRPATLQTFGRRLTRAGLLRLLRIPSLPSHAREPSRRDKPVMIDYDRLEDVVASEQLTATNEGRRDHSTERHVQIAMRSWRRGELLDQGIAPGVLRVHFDI